MLPQEKCLQAKFFGKVQGIGFRHFVREKAQELGLKGWVRNCEDGSVELEAFGKREVLEKLLEGLQHETAPGTVERIEKQFSSKKSELKSFEIRF